MRLPDVNRFSIVFLCRLVIYSSSYVNGKVSLYLAGGKYIQSVHDGFKEETGG